MRSISTSVSTGNIWWRRLNSSLGAASAMGSSGFGLSVLNDLSDRMRPKSLPRACRALGRARAATGTCLAITTRSALRGNSMSALNKKQIQSLRKQLDQREAQLHEEIRWADADRAEAPAHHPREQVEDSGEYSEQHTREVVSDAETERDHEELQEIAAAKERMLQGGYG